MCKLHDCGVVMVMMTMMKMINIMMIIDVCVHRESYTCPSPTCEVPMVDHIRRFVHGHGCINVLLKKLDNPVPGAQENILLWSWCRRCKQVTTVIILVRILMMLVMIVNIHDGITMLLRKQTALCQEIRTTSCYGASVAAVNK